MKTTKEFIGLRDELTKKKRDIEKRIRDGKEFFIKEMSGNTSAQRLSSGASTMISLVDSVIDIDKEIRDLDILIIVSLEKMAYNEKIILNLPERVNEAGDLVERTDVTLREDIDVDDLWFLKLAKGALGPNGIEIIKNENK
ncbi:MAG: hypothetical protein RR420_01390 [Anaerovoracaceae bacterium]